MKFTPRSGNRFNTRKASGLSDGGPQTPLPVMRIAPKPRRLTSSSPPMRKVPEWAAVKVAMGPPLFSVALRQVGGKRILVFGMPARQRRTILDHVTHGPSHALLIHRTCHIVVGAQNVE